MINQYVREYKIGSGSYGKVVSLGFHCTILSLNECGFPELLSLHIWQALYRNSIDGKHYAIKVRIVSGMSRKTTSSRQIGCS